MNCLWQPKDVKLARNNYAYEKRQRDLAKKKKKEEKKMKKQNQTSGLNDSADNIEEIDDSGEQDVSESEDRENLL